MAADAPGGYLPVPNASNLTKCAREKPWRVDIVPRTDTSTGNVFEQITLYKPNTPCAATYYTHQVSIYDANNGLTDVHYTAGPMSTSQTVHYGVARVGSITFEVATGNQGFVDCQFWDYVATAKSQPQFVRTYKAAGPDC